MPTFGLPLTVAMGGNRASGRKKATKYNFVRVYRDHHTTQPQIPSSKDDPKLVYVVCDLKHKTNFRHLHHSSNLVNIQFDRTTDINDIDIYECKQTARKRLREVQNSEMRLITCLEEDIYDITFFFDKMRFNYIP